MLSHTVSTLYTAIFCIIYILFKADKLKDKEIIKKCIINVVFILLVSMLFWLPLLEATNHAEYTIMNDRLMRTYGDFAASNTISFSQLFVDSGEEDGTTFLIGIPTVIAILLSFYSARKMDLKFKEYYFISIIFAIISLFTASIFFPWKVMPSFLCKLQYPWRMQGFFIFFISFVCGSNLYYAIKHIIKKDIIRLILISLYFVIAVISSIVIISQFFAIDMTKDREYEDSILNNRKISHLRINRDYMPVKAINLQKTYVEERDDRTYILIGTAIIDNEVKDNLKDVLNVKNIEENTIMEFPYYYYVGYRISIETDGNIEYLEPIESENGYLSYQFDKKIDDAKITVEYVGTSVTTISYIVSAISLIGFIGYIIYEKKH